MENILYKTRTYLVGHMQYANGRDWRDYVEGELAGVFGLWFAVRHYAGKTCEVDHVYIKPEYRNQGLGKQAFQWIYDYAREQGCETSELNAYVHNFPSHKFYMNENYVIKGYHFLKKL